MEGKIINGYTLRKRLGIGGMAEVWYAENRIGKNAAVKILLPELCQNEKIVERFITEAKTMVLLDHPNIREVYDYGEIDNRPAIVMEYLDGDDLKTRLKHGQHFTDEELIKWWDQLVDALNYTHEKGIVHRDIKPGNIFVDKKGNIKLLDFGIAKVRESISSTQTGQKLGTLMYMSPEQVKDSKHTDYHTDNHTDIYSLAVTFVHLITGKKPYDSDTSSDFEISEQIVYKPLELKELPDNWRRFLEPYLAKEAEARPDLKRYEEPEPEQPAENNAVSDDATVFESEVKQEKEKKPEEEPEKEEEPIKEEKTVAETDVETMPKPKKRKKGLVIACFIVAAIVAALLVIPNMLKPAEVYPTMNLAGDMYGLIDAKGNVILKPTYQFTYWSTEGLALFEEDGLYGFLDNKGKVAIKAKYDDTKNCFSEGLAAVQKDGEWFFIDKEGKKPFKNSFDNVKNFSEGLSAVYDANQYRWGFIDKTGKLVIDYKYRYLEDDFHDGIALVEDDEGELLCINKEGKKAFTFKYDDCYGFREGLAVVDAGNYVCFINTEGKKAFKESYEDAYDFSEGMAAVKDEDSGLYGFIDKTGKLVIDYQYKSVSEDGFDKGLVPVRNKQGWGLIDKKGNEVVECKYDYNIAMNHNGVFLMTVSDDDYEYYDYINTKGEIFYSFKSMK